MVLGPPKVYRPRGNIRQVFDWIDGVRQAPVQVLVEGPANTGKSRALAEFDYECAAKWTYTKVLVLRRYRTDLHKSWQRTFEDMVLYPGHPLLTKTGGGKGEGRSFYQFDNGSTITLGHMEDPQRWYSSEWDIVHWVESNESRADQWERLFRSLRKGERPTQCPFAPGLIIGEMNPDVPQFHLNQAAKLGKVHRIITRHKDNPRITEAELDILRSMTGVRRRRLYLGEWCAAEGQIWDCFDSEFHIVQPDQVPELKWYAAGLDFGRRNPGCLLIAGFDSDGNGWIVAEAYRTGWTLEDWAACIYEVHQTMPLSIVVADCADGGTGAIQVMNDRLGIQGSKGPLVHGVRKVKVGDKNWGWAMREHVYTLLKAGTLRFLDDPFRLLGGPDPNLQDKGVPRSVTDEIAEFVYFKAPEGREIPTDRRENPDPMCADHGCDALMYLASEVYDANFTPAIPDSGLPDCTLAAELGHAEVWAASTRGGDSTFDDYTTRRQSRPGAFRRRRY